MHTIRRFGVAALFGLSVLATASCGGGEKNDQQAALDSTMDAQMGGDTALAGQQEQEPAPAPQTRTTQRPATRQPAQPKPQPKPQPETRPAASYITGTVPSGTSFQVTLNQTLSTKDNQSGDLWTGTLTSPLTDGSRVLIPQGATLRGSVTAVQKSGGAGQQAVIKLAINEFSVDGQTFPVQASVTEANPETKGRSSTASKAAKIGGGAAAGAILGRIIGGNAKGTVIGAAVGAAAGTAITLGTEDVDAVLPEGSSMTVQLDAPLSVKRKVSS